MDDTDNIMVAVQTILEIVQEEFAAASAKSEDGRWTGLDADSKHRIDVKARDEVRHHQHAGVHATGRHLEDFDDLFASGSPGGLALFEARRWIQKDRNKHILRLVILHDHFTAQVNRLRAVFKTASNGLDAMLGLRLTAAELEALEADLTKQSDYYE